MSWRPGPWTASKSRVRPRVATSPADIRGSPCAINTLIFSLGRIALSYSIHTHALSVVGSLAPSECALLYIFGAFGAIRLEPGVPVDRNTAGGQAQRPEQRPDSDPLGCPDTVEGSEPPCSHHEHARLPLHRACAAPPGHHDGQRAGEVHGK